MNRSCIIEWRNELGIDIDQRVASEVFARVAYHVTQADSIVIFPNERDRYGFMEWIIQIQYAGGGALTIGAVQRGVDSPVEFHS